jgi:N-acetylmuramoyl-L-alanine amidase
MSREIFFSPQKKSYQIFTGTVFFCVLAILIFSQFAGKSNDFSGKDNQALKTQQHSNVFYKIKTVVIDAGHGGKDPGTHGLVTKEKDIALKIALEVGKLIKSNIPGVKVVYTRSTDIFIPLNERANIANRNKADLFMSIHCNANANSKAIYGTETYVMGLHKSEDNLEVVNRENAVVLQEDNYEENYDGFDPNSPVANIVFSNYQNAFLENSLKFAQLVENQFKNKAGRKSRGVKQQGFIVLWKTTMPSVLIEAGYLTNKEEEAYLNTQQGRSYIASAIYRAFKEYKQAVESDD